MTYDEVYEVIKEEGIKNVAKGYIANRPNDEWVVWTNKENVFLLDEGFFVKHSINAIFKTCPANGERVFKKFYANKYPKKVWKKRMLDVE
jgi:hypothetical protein